MPSEKRKKHKRKSRTRPTSSKRVKVEDEKPVKIKIKVMTTKEGDSNNKNPIVVSFPGGLPTCLLPPSSEDNVSCYNDEKVPEFTLRRPNPPNRTPMKKKKRTPMKNAENDDDDRCHIFGRDSTCHYEGSIRSSKNKKEHRIQRLCVGVYNKRTGVLEVSLTAGDGGVCALQQSVPEYEEGRSEGLLKTNTDRYNALFKEFGSTKKKKAINAKDMNRIRLEAGDATVKKNNSILSKAFMNQTGMSESNKQALEKLKGKEEERMDAVQLAYMEARKMLLPAWNKDADKPSEVYNVREMVGATNWGKLSTETKSMLRNVSDKEEWYDTLVENRFKWHDCIKYHVLKKITFAPNAQNLVTTAQALNHMITFWYRVGLSSRPLKGDGMEFAKGLKIPIDITTHFMKTFLTHLSGHGRHTRYALGNHDRDRLLVHILLLYLTTHIVDIHKQGGAVKEIMKADTMVHIVQQLSKSTNEEEHGNNNSKKIDLPNLTFKLLREAGCIVERKTKRKAAEEESEAWDFTVVLRVPLKFPKPASRGRGAR